MATRRRFLVLMAGGAATAGLAAGGYLLFPDDEAAGTEPTIKYGAEPCQQCGMLISDERFAAAWRERGGKEQHFDDVGCLVSHYRAHDPGADARLFVMDFAGSRWLDGRTAVFVPAPGIKSPMAYDVAAFASEEAARSALGTRAAGPVQNWVVLVRDLPGRG